MTPKVALWKAQMKLVNEPLERKFKRAWLAEIRRVRASARATDKPFNRKAEVEQTVAALRPVYEAGFTFAGSAFLRASFTLRKKGITKARRNPNPAIGALVGTISERIGMTIDTAFETLADAVEAGQEDGMTSDEIEAMLEDDWDAIEGKADTIAATEVSTVANSARDYLMQTVVEYGDWATADDERVRVTHAIYGEAGPRPVGSNYADLINERYSLKYPCDPDCDEAGEIINCRCILIPADDVVVAAEDIEGYLADFGMTLDDLGDSDFAPTFS